MGTNYEVARDYISMCVHGSKYKHISVKQQSVIRKRLKVAMAEIK